MSPNNVEERDMGYDAITATYGDLTATIPKTLPPFTFGGDGRQISITLKIPYGRKVQKPRVLAGTGVHPSELKIFSITPTKFVIVCNMEDAQVEELTTTPYWLVTIHTHGEWKGHSGGWERAIVDFEVHSLNTSCHGLWVKDVFALDGGNYILFSMYDAHGNKSWTTWECYETKLSETDWYTLDLCWMADFPCSVVPVKHTSDHVLFDVDAGGKISASSGGLKINEQLPMDCFGSKTRFWKEGMMDWKYELEVKMLLQ